MMYDQLVWDNYMMYDQLLWDNCMLYDQLPWETTDGDVFLFVLLSSSI